ncbi:MAG: hypothetical protein ACYTF7_06865 [Planctomycetota bacterium]
MKVYLDETEVVEAGQTLGSALEAARGEASRQNRVIVEVWADGERTGDDEIASPPEFAPYADEIRMVSVDPGALVISTLYDASDAMSEVTSMQERACETIQRGERTESLRQMQEIIGVWDSARRAIEHGCALLGVRPGEMLGREDRFGQSVGQLTDTLRTLLGDAQREDWVSVGDTLEDELCTLAGEWRSMLADLADAVSRQREEKA